MAELSLEQQRALALARARMRAAQAGSAAKPAPASMPGKADREYSWGETAMDAAKQLGAGALQGGAALVSLPRDAGQWLGEKVTGGIDYMMGVPADERARRQQSAQAAMGQSSLAAPSYQDAIGGIEKVTGPLPEAQTTAGRYANTIGQFSTAALGPGGLFRKAASVVVPAVASEAAGQAVEGSAIEPYVRAGTALATGVGVGMYKGGKTNPLRQMQDAAPSADAVKARTDALYGQLRNAGIKYDANTVNQTVADVQKLRIDPVLHPKAARLAELVTAKAGQSLDFEDLDYLKQIGGDIMRSTAEAKDKFFAAAILDKLDNVANGPFITNGSIPAGQVNDLVREAKDYARRNIMARQIDEMSDKSQGYLAGEESGMRNQFGSYLKGQRRKSLTPAERRAFERVVKREGALNVAHMAGSRIGNVMNFGAGLAAAPFTGGTSLIASGVGALGSLGARAALDKYTRNAVESARKTALAGRGAQSQAMAAIEREAQAARLRALLAAENARRAGGEAPAYGLLNGP